MSAIKGLRLVQMPVPPVRPLLRRTIKRFLRLLPSVLLLLFVISLIFVTLMQIAVIHTHRRSLVFQRNLNSGALAINGPASGELTTLSPASGAARTTPGTLVKKKQEVLRIEALLDKTLPSVDTNSKILLNFINSGRIKQIISLAQSEYALSFPYSLSSYNRTSNESNETNLVVTRKKGAEQSRFQSDRANVRQRKVDFVVDYRSGNSDNTENNQVSDDFAHGDDSDSEPNKTDLSLSVAPKSSYPPLILNKNSPTRHVINNGSMPIVLSSKRANRKEKSMCPPVPPKLGKLLMFTSCFLITGMSYPNFYPELFFSFLSRYLLMCSCKSYSRTLHCYFSTK